MTPIRTPETAEIVLNQIAAGLSVRQIARDLGCSDAAITRWAVEDPDGFGKQYARAREAQAEHMAAEILEIADDGSNDWMERETEAGRIVTVPDHEHINRSKLRVDTRKFLMAKMAPKVYGDKPQDINVNVSLRDMIRQSATIEHEPTSDHAAPQQIGNAKVGSDE